MVNIERIGSGVVITTDGCSNIYPLGSLYSIITEDAEGIVLKMKASRKAIHEFTLAEMANPSAATTEELQDAIALLLG